MALPAGLAEIDSSTMAVIGRASDYPAGHLIESHAHNKHQLIYAVHGVMMVAADEGQWIVPPTRGIWMPAGQTHRIRCIGIVQMRSIFVHPQIVPHLPDQSHAVGISPLLRELIRAATEVQTPYAADSRDERLMRLLLDELRALKVLPLHLPKPVDARLKKICTRVLAYPDDDSTMSHWARQLDVDVKTIQRLFVRETGMTYGQWRQQARLLHALEKLAVGEKVVDVALSVGYSNPGAFATMFKRQFGETPSDFFR